MDMTQEIFLSVLKTIGYYDPKKAEFRTWLYKVATNKIIDYRRRNRPECVPVEELQLQDFTQISPEQSAFVKEIEAYISLQEPSHQQLFRLHLYAGYSFAELSTLYGEPESTIKSKYYRLIQKIRKEFTHEDTNPNNK